MKPFFPQSQMKPLFLQGPPITLRLLFFSLLSLALMTVDHREHHLDIVRADLSAVVYPLQYAAGLPILARNWLEENLATRQTLITQNTAFNRQTLLLHGQMQKFAALEAENVRLRELLQSSQKLTERMLIAELLAVDMDPFRHQVTLNKGARAGVVEGQPLLDSTGVIGQVVHVGPYTSTALLITDPSHALPVQINRNGLRGIAIGTGSFNSLDLPFLSKDADVQVGDLLITSGLGGGFPADYPVARVTSVKRDPGQPFAKVTAAPTARLERSREVLLVWPTKPTPAMQEQQVADANTLDKPGAPAPSAALVPSTQNPPAAVTAPAPVTPALAAPAAGSTPLPATVPADAAAAPDAFTE